MKVNQIANVLNTAIIKEGIGTEVVVKEDLTNIVDVGKTVLDYTGQSKDNFNNFVQGLIDQIGRVQFVDRTYRSTAPKIVYDSWEYGSIMMKVRCEVPEFQDNVSWKLGDIFKDAEDNSKTAGIADYKELDPFVLSIPKATAKFYNSKITYECPITIAEAQLRTAFQSAGQMGSFIAMIENRIQLKMTLSTDQLVMRTINNLIGLKVNKNQNVVNLLDEYNAAVSGDEVLTAEEALRDTKFLRFATKTITLYKDYLKTAGTLYNDGNYITFTPEERLKFIVLSEFAKDMETYLYSDTYHNEFVKMEGYSTVPFWQGTGKTGADFDSRSTIDVEVSDENAVSGKTEVARTGIVAVMFDRDAAAVCNENYRTTSQYNPRGEYFNYFYKYDSSYMNDVEENCVVFLVNDYSFTMVAPATKPADWDTTYAVANSVYYIEDENGTVLINGQKFKALSASDKSTAQGYDWNDYKGKQIFKKIS